MPLHRLTFRPTCEPGSAEPVRRLRPGLAGLAIGLLLSAGLAHAQAPQPGQEAVQAERDAAHARIAAERQAIQQRRSQQEKACYQRFAVEDCLAEVRKQARTEDNALRLQDQEISAVERREKSANRLLSIEQKSQEPRAKPPVDGKARVPKGAPAPTGVPADAGVAQEQAAQLRAQEARERAQAQSQHQQSHAAELARKQAGEAERRAAARQRSEAKQRQAQEHKQRQKAKAESQAGKPKPAPLPPVPNAAPASPSPSPSP